MTSEVSSYHLTNAKSDINETCLLDVVRIKDKERTFPSCYEGVEGAAVLTSQAWDTLKRVENIQTNLGHAHVIRLRYLGNFQKMVGQQPNQIEHDES